MKGIAMSDYDESQDEELGAYRDMQARVQRGMRLLDERVPGWQVDIDLDELDMHSCDRCIVGQLYRSGRLRADDAVNPWYGFHDALSALGVANASLFGFDIPSDHDGFDFDDLDEEWTMRLVEA
jgi:hypothetical protein